MNDEVKAMLCTVGGLGLITMIISAIVLTVLGSLKIGIWLFGI